MYTFLYDIGLDKIVWHYFGSVYTILYVYQTS